METQPSTPQRTGFLDKKITLRWASILIGIVVVAGLVFWTIKALECRRIGAGCSDALRKSTMQSAENLARAIAVVGNRQIVDRKYESMQDFADNLVRSRPITFIAIVDLSDRAVVHTDRNLLGKKWTMPEEKPNILIAQVPVMDFTDKVATVYVGARM